MVQHPTCAIPKRSILTKEDLCRFESSEAFLKFTSFLEALNAAVIGKTLQTKTNPSRTIIKILELLKTIKSFVEEIPAAPMGKSRFGYLKM